jgi:hypothetical protein
MASALQWTFWIVGVCLGLLGIKWIWERAGEFVMVRIRMVARNRWAQAWLLQVSGMCDQTVPVLTTYLANGFVSLLQHT